MDPISLALSLCIRGFLFVVKIFFLFVRKGFFWLMAGYFVNYVMIENPTTKQHIICMIVAWGGTFIHFFGKKIFVFVNKKLENSNQ